MSRQRLGGLDFALRSSRETAHLEYLMLLLETVDGRRWEIRPTKLTVSLFQSGQGEAIFNGPNAEEPDMKVFLKVVPTQTCGPEHASFRQTGLVPCSQGAWRGGSLISACPPAPRWVDGFWSSRKVSTLHTAIPKMYVTPAVSIVMRYLLSSSTKMLCSGR